MRTELPESKRCCFCLPLRYGLLTWGYVKLIAALIMFIPLLMTVIHMVELVLQYRSPLRVYYIVIFSLVLILLLIDVVLNILFIVGGHRKNAKLLRVYYIYSIVMLALTIVLVLVMVFLLTPGSPDSFISYRGWLLLLDFSSYFVNIVLQCYLLLLLRSEIRKLQNNCEFRFVNNAAEGECVMKYKEEMADEEKETENVCEKGTCETTDECEEI